MYSHLDNLQETSSPLRQTIRQALEDLRLKKNFDLNPLRASRNYEKSIFMKVNAW